MKRAFRKQLSRLARALQSENELREAAPKELNRLDQRKIDNWVDIVLERLKTKW